MPTQDCNGLSYIVKPISVYARTSTQGEVQSLIMHALFILYPNYIQLIQIRLTSTIVKLMANVQYA